MSLSLVVALALAGSPVSLKFEGPLKDAIQAIAQQGGLNVVVVGDFAEPTQVRLENLAAEDALGTLAEAYGLAVTRSNGLWVIRRASGDAPAPAAAAEAAQEAVEAAQEEAEAAKEDAVERALALREEAQARVEVDRHRVAAGGPVTVERGSEVETAVAYGGPVIVEEGAVVTGDAVAFGGDVVLHRGAVVQGDAVAFGGRVVKGEGAVVRGDAVAFGGSRLGGALARGVARSQRSVQVAPGAVELPSVGAGHSVAGFLARFAVFFGLGFLLMMFAPQRMRNLEATVRAEPGKNALAGFLGLLAAVPLTVMLAVTVIGIPVAVLLWLGVAFFVPVGLAVVANTLGASLPTGRLRKTQALALGLGLLALMLAAEVPVLGPLLLSAAIFVSLGAILRTRFGQPPKGTPVLDPLRGVAVS